MKIGIDLDGVVCDFMGSARVICKELFDKPDDSLIQTGWGLDSLGINQEEENQMWNVIDTQNNWWLTLDDEPGTSELARVVEEHDVYFITNRKRGQGDSVEVQSGEWLYNHHGLMCPTVISIKNKGPLIAALGLDYFIDDRDKNLEACLEFAPKCKPYMKYQPYNTIVPGVPVALDLNNFFSIIGA